MREEEEEIVEGLTDSRRGAGAWRARGLAIPEGFLNGWRGENEMRNVKRDEGGFGSENRGR